MSGFRWPRQKRQADAQVEQLKTWFSSSSRWATILEDDELTGNGILVSDVYEDYTTAATESIIACGAPPAPGMQHAVRTFLESPVVRAAFADFKAQYSFQEHTPVVESELIQTLASLAASFGRLRLDTTNTRVSWQEARLDIGDDKLTQMVMEYLVRIEIWRLKGLANGRPWTFGTQRARYQFLASTLVQFWYMDREACFCFRDVRTSSRDWSILWDRWADKCIKSDAAVSLLKVEMARGGSPRLPSPDGKAHGDVCIGVGWRPEGWLEKA